MAGNRFAIEAAGHDAAVLFIRVAGFQGRRVRPQLAAVERTDERREEVAAIDRTRGQRHGRIERLDRLWACFCDRLALIDAEVERPTLVQLPALRQAGIREQARTELGRALIDARLQLRAFPRHGAHAETCSLGVEAIAVRVLPLAEEGRA